MEASTPQNLPVNHGTICDRGQSTGTRVWKSAPCFGTGSVGDQVLSQLGDSISLLHSSMSAGWKRNCLFSTPVLAYLQKPGALLMCRPQLGSCCPLKFHHNSDYSQGDFKPGEGASVSRQRIQLIHSQYLLGTNPSLNCSWGWDQSWSLPAGAVMCRQLVGSCRSSSKKQDLPCP